MNLYEKIQLNLTDDLINIIYNFIPNIELIFINKKYYFTYHYLMENNVFPNSYMRFVLRNDFNFIFNNLIETNYLKNRYITRNDIRYKNKNKSIFLLLDYSIQNNSNKCKIILDKFIKDNGLVLNRYKNKRKKNIEWTN
jgi:hypothetical protein